MNGVSLAAEMANAADSWLRSLTADQRAAAAYPGPGVGDRERTTWFYTPTDHGGLTLNEQRPGQQQLAMRLLSAGLSLEGHALAAIVMSLENVEDRREVVDARLGGGNAAATRERTISGRPGHWEMLTGDGAAAADDIAAELHHRSTGASRRARRVPSGRCRRN